MSEGELSTAGARLTKALALLEHHLSGFEARLDRYLAAPPPVDEALHARHEALKAEVAAVIAELDEMVGTSPVAPEAGATHHG